jgi:hypothetical protein
MATASRDEPAHPRIKRWILGLLTALSALVGLAPLALSQDAMQTLPFVAAAVLAIASLELRRLKYKSTDFTSPKFLEFLLAGMGAVFWFAVGAFFALVVSGTVWGLSRLVELVAGFHEIHVWVDPVVFWLGVILLGFFVIVCTPLCVSWLHEQLYPSRWGARSAYYDLIAKKPRKVVISTLIFAGISVVAALVILSLDGQFARLSYIGLQLYIFFASATLFNIEHKEADTLKALLIAAGYTVKDTVLTGDKTVDHLLTVIDFVAERDPRLFAFNITTEPSEPDGVRWERGAALRTAALTYGKNRRLAQAVEPVMVLVGVMPSEGLMAFAKNESLRVRSIPLPTMQLIRDTHETERLKDLATTYLQLDGFAVRSDTLGDENGGTR